MSVSDCDHLTESHIILGYVNCSTPDQYCTNMTEAQSIKPKKKEKRLLTTKVIYIESPYESFSNS